MTLTALIKHFRKGGNIDKFYKLNKLNVDSEIIEIYMQKPLSFENQIFFFELEKTKGKIEYELEGQKYYNLIDFQYFLDFINETNSGFNKLKPSQKFAKILFNYCLNDG